MDLNAITVSHAVAEAAGLRAAADRPGGTGSAVSQTSRKLEGSLGVAIGATGARSERPWRLLRLVGAASDLGEQNEARSQQQCAILWVKRQGQWRGGRCKRDPAQMKQTAQPGPPAKAARSGDGDSASELMQPHGGVGVPSSACRPKEWELAG